MERHAPSGQYFNWYDHRTGAKLTTWPPTGAPLTPILSSVDNGWLATGLQIVRNTRAGAAAARPARCSTRWTSASTTGPSVNRILFHYVPSTRAPRPCCYDTVVSESRIADYIGIAKGELPRKTLLRALAQLPRHLRLELAGDAPGRASTAATTA